jgi:hypothetical protein
MNPWRTFGGDALAVRTNRGFRDKNAINFQPIATPLETAEKKYVGVGGVFYSKFV